MFPSSQRRSPLHKRPLVLESLILALMLGAVAPLSHAKDSATPQIDSDQDGLSDTLEQALLVQFVPQFQIGQGDCSNVPAEFQTGVAHPTVASQNGTIYGQVFPAKSINSGAPAVEIHYYHLWQSDCGKHGHPLDAEHVSVLVQASSPDLNSATWQALYWYAAAHEDTVCDVSQIAHASTLHAKDAGPAVWISPGKHASYLNPTLCQRGCGADHCQKMTALDSPKLINLGEPAHPMNDSAFIASTAWPLAVKMSTTNFPPATLTRLSTLPDSEIAWFNTGKHPAQGIIAISSTTEQAIAGGGQSTINALNTASEATDNSLAAAQGSTGNALQKGYRHTIHALGTTFRHIGNALDLTDTDSPPQPEAK